MANLPVPITTKEPLTMVQPTTLGEFIVENQRDFPFASGELSQLLTSIRLAAKVVNREINKAGLADILGAIGSENVQGEQQQKLGRHGQRHLYARTPQHGSGLRCRFRGRRFLHRL